MAPEPVERNRGAAASAHAAGEIDSPAADALLAAVVRLALTEDIGPGDATTLATVDPKTRAIALVVARAPGVLSGVEAAREVARAVDPAVRFEADRRDGDRLVAGDPVIRLEGPARSLLSMERVLLNFLQRLSGVASLTARYVEAVSGTGVAIADTRKTTPALRLLEKAAVRHGGGINHRFGLYDACMIKDNHIVAAGGITAAVDRVRSCGCGLHLTVEARAQAEAEEAARLQVDQILLDNMEPAEIVQAVASIRRAEAAAAQGTAVGAAAEKRIRIEVSGGVTLETVRAKALPGVDLISVGALTHSAPALDLAMDLTLTPPGESPA
jgi:nicotinate-nucleotide pyrophosphorylase (carboxylating)